MRVAPEGQALFAAAAQTPEAPMCPLGIALWRSVARPVVTAAPRLRAFSAAASPCALLLRLRCRAEARTGCGGIHVSGPLSLLGPMSLKFASFGTE